MPSEMALSRLKLCDGRSENEEEETTRFASVVSMAECDKSTRLGLFVATLLQPKSRLLSATGAMIGTQDEKESSLALKATL